MIHKPPRVLSKGFAWQSYEVVAVKPISYESHKEQYQSNRWNMEHAHDTWTDEMTAYIYDRSEELGLGVVKIAAQIVEEPNESKSVELSYWNKNNCVFVWSMWATIIGPLPERLISKKELPLLNFWPEDLSFEKGQCEVFDAAALTKREQSGIVW